MIARLAILLCVALLAQCGDVATERKNDPDAPATWIADTPRNFPHDRAPRPDSAKAKAPGGPIDTASFTAFWQSFQRSVARDARREVMRVLDYPVRPGEFIYFHFSVDCDEERINADADRFFRVPLDSAEYDSTEVGAIYPFLFSRALRSVIARLSAERMLREGFHGDEDGLAYSVHARDFIKVACENDKSLMIRVIRKEGEWRVAFVGCC